MARNSLRAMLSIGLSATTLVFSFLGCGSVYEDVSTGVGSCEDDKNPCTIDTCTTGATVHTPATDGDVCSLGNNPGKCQKNDMGTTSRCVLECESNPEKCKCATKVECPEDETCATWDCNAGQCARSPAREGELIDGAQTTNDCKKTICSQGNIEIANDDDTLVEKEGVQLLVDPMSYQYLVGAEIDYQESLQGSQFVIKNPNASSTCGCGSSFSV